MAERSENVGGRQLTIGKALSLSLSVLVVYAIVAWILLAQVMPLRGEEHKEARSGLALLAAALGILAGGCTTAFFAYEYRNAQQWETRSVCLMSAFFITADFLLVFLCIYCLRKGGALSAMDDWATVLLFCATYFLLAGIVLLERWDFTWAPQRGRPESGDAIGNC